MVRIGVAMLLAAAGCGGSTATAPSSAPPTSHLSTVHLDGDPFAVAVGPDGDVWTATHDGAQVLRVDASTRRVVSTTPIAGQGTALAMTGNGLWAVGWKHALYHIDAAAGHADRTVQLPRPDQVAVDGGRIWVTNEQRTT